MSRPAAKWCQQKRTISKEGALMPSMALNGISHFNSFPLSPISDVHTSFNKSISKECALDALNGISHYNSLSHSTIWKYAHEFHKSKGISEPWTTENGAATFVNGKKGDVPPPLYWQWVGQFLKKHLSPFVYATAAWEFMRVEVRHQKEAGGLIRICNWLLATAQKL